MKQPRYSQTLRRRWSSPVRGLTVALVVAGTAGWTVAQAAPKKAPPPPPVPEAPPPPNPEIEALKTKAAALEETLKKQQDEAQAFRLEMQKQIEAERAERRTAEAALKAQSDAAAQKAAEAPVPVSATRTGLTLSGFAQIDYAIRQSSEDQLNASTGDPLNEDRFNVRRARLRVGLDRYYVAGALELDANTVKGSQVRIVTAEASLKWPGTNPGVMPLVMGTIGLFKIPFGFEVVQSDRDRLFLERSTIIRALFPGEYDLGARLQGGWRFLRYAIAAQNGDPVGERNFPARDPNQAKDITGRLGAEASIYGGFAFAGGFSGSAGKGLHKGTPATKPSLFWQDRNENGRFDGGELMIAPGSSATPSQNFSRHAMGLDARLTFTSQPLGDTTLYGEAIWAKSMDRSILVADPQGPLGRDLREQGFYVALMQDVTSHGSVGVRYDSYNPDRDSTNRLKGTLVPTTFTYSTVAIAAALRAPSGRLIFEYDVNRNKLGRDAQGIPGNLKDNAFTVRAEVRF